MDKLNQKVERILRTKPQTRNDDFLLINEVYKSYISTQSARRKIQKENEELKACDIVELARSI